MIFMKPKNLELEHLISQLTLCAPAANASVDELQDFRRVRLEGAIYERLGHRRSQLVQGEWS